MIDKETLSSYKTFKDPYQVEKDYLQDLLLYALYSKPSGNDLVLKGGTAFSKFYNSDRFSEDLDFALINSGSNNTSKAAQLISESVPMLEYKTSFKEAPKENEHGTLTAIIVIRGPRYNGKQSTEQQVKVEISTGRKLLMEPVAMPRNPVYSDARNYVALVMQKEEIVAEKFRALLSQSRRHRERDLYDLYYFIGKGTKVDKAMLNKKLEEVGMAPADYERVVNAIKSLEKSWKDLEPFVQHRLEPFEYVAGIVEKGFLGEV